MNSNSNLKLTLTWALINQSPNPTHHTEPPAQLALPTNLPSLRRRPNSLPLSLSLADMRDPHVSFPYPLWFSSLSCLSLLHAIRVTPVPASELRPRRWPSELCVDFLSGQGSPGNNPASWAPRSVPSHNTTATRCILGHRRPKINGKQCTAAALPITLELAQTLAPSYKTPAPIPSSRRPNSGDFPQDAGLASPPWPRH